MDAVHPGTPTAMTTPDVKAVDVDACLDGAFTKVRNGPKQVEEVNVRCCFCHQHYGQPVEGEANQD